MKHSRELLKTMLCLSMFFVFHCSFYSHAQPSTFRVQPQSRVQLPDSVESAFVLGGKLYCYSSGVLFAVERDYERLLSYTADTDYVKLSPDINYIVRHPESGDLYFTARDRRGRSVLYRCQRESGKRPKIKEVDIEGFAVEHPAFSPDGKMLVFSSTGRKGNADYDLWYCRWDKNGWCKPHNLGGRVNTLLDERAPVINGNYLYFTSNGRDDAEGRHTLYVTTLQAQASGDTVGIVPLGRGRVQRLPWPFNAQGEDSRGLLFDPNLNCGYLLQSSLASFSLPLAADALWGYVRDMAGTPLSDALVSIYSGGNTPVATATTNADGYYHLHLAADQTYRISVRRAGYFTDSAWFQAPVDPSGLLVGDLHRDVSLTRLALNTRLYYTDLFGPNASIELTDAGRHRLDPLVRFLNDNPGYSADLILVADLTADSAFNALLTEHRMQALKHYLATAIPSSVRLQFFNSCSGREGCTTATGADRLTAIISEK